jgi:intracellular multiplication protein IcmC
MSDATTWLASNYEIINNIARSVAPIERMISGFAYVMGIMFAIKAISSLKQYGESRSAMSSNNANMKEPMVYLLVAAIFIYLPTGLQIILNTTFGSADANILAYQPVNNGIGSTLFGSGSNIGQSLTLIIQAIGIVAFVRGWILIARSASQGQQPGGTGKGLVHVFGGILAMNIVVTLEIINNTLYGSH